MGYISMLDQKQTIAAAKKEMDDFADLLKLVSPTRFPGISAVSFHNTGEAILDNYDFLKILAIETEDQRHEEIRNVSAALNRMEQLETELLWMKHIEKKSFKQMENIFNLSKSSIYNKLNKAYLHFAIIYNNEVPVAGTEGSESESFRR